jgi:hypothetical protein
MTEVVTLGTQTAGIKEFGLKCRVVGPDVCGLVASFRAFVDLNRPLVTLESGFVTKFREGWSTGAF